MHHRLLGLLLACAVFWMPDSARCQTKKQKDRGPAFPRIANLYGAGIQRGMIRQNRQRLDFAAQYDLLVGGVLHDADEEIKYLKARNPKIILLKYVSARGKRPNDKNMKPEWWLNDAQGGAITPWPGVNLVNETSPGLNKYLIYTTQLVFERQPLFDGVFLDSFAPDVASLNKGNLDANRDGKPDDPKWLNDSWKNGLLRLADGMSQLREGKAIVVANGGGPLDFGYEYLNGCLIEDTLIHVAKGNAKWDDVIRGYLRWFEALRVPRVSVVVSGGGAVEDPWVWEGMSQAERDAEAERARRNLQAMRFGLCATLMGDGYYAYDYQTPCRGQFWWYPEFDAPLGYPTGAAFARPDGAWQREYDGGSVVVNPTLEAVTVAFAGTRKDVSSGEEANTLSVPPRDGRIFLVTQKVAH